VTNIANPIAGLAVPSSGTNALGIAGTPTATGTETFTVTATDASGATTSTDYSITINPAVTLSPATLPAATSTTAYNQTITASGGSGDKALAVTNIANAIAGLTLPTSGTNTLAITGTPTGSGTETFTITATDAAGATYLDRLQHHHQPRGDAQPRHLAGRHDQHRLQPDESRPAAVRATRLWR